jgi:hypothetical protein
MAQEPSHLVRNNKPLALLRLDALGVVAVVEVVEDVGILKITLVTVLGGQQA